MLFAVRCVLFVVWFVLVGWLLLFSVLCVGSWLFVVCCLSIACGV